MRDEFLKETTFTSLAQAHRLLEDWRRDYNGFRPLSAIGWLIPNDAGPFIGPLCQLTVALGFRRPAIALR